MPKRTLLICATPRSGSHFAADLIWSTGSLGHPREFACKYDVIQWRDYLGCESYSDYRERFVDLHSTNNGVLAVVVMNFQYQMLLTGNSEEEKLLHIVMDNHCHGKGVTIYLTRKDRLSQAVSWAIAKHLHYWHYMDSPKDDEVSNTHLLEAWDFINSEYNAWNKTFINHGFAPSEFVYEEWTSDIRSFISDVSVLMGQNCDKSRPLTVLRQKNSYDKFFLLRERLQRAIFKRQSHERH